MELFFYAVIHVGVSVALTASLVLVYCKIRKDDFLLYWAGFWACIGWVLWTVQVLPQYLGSAPATSFVLSMLGSTVIFLFPLFLVFAGIAAGRPLHPRITRPWIILAMAMGWTLGIVRYFDDGLSTLVIQLRPLGIVLGLAFLTYRLAAKGHERVGAINRVLVGICALYLTHNLVLFLSTLDVVSIYPAAGYSAQAATIGILLQVALTFVLSYSVIQKAQEATSQASEASRRLHSLLGKVRLAGIIVGRNGCVEFCNPWLAQMLVTSAENVVGTPWVDRFVPEREQSTVRSVFEAGFTSGQWPAIHEYSVQNKGRTISLNWYHTSLLDTSGTVIGAASIGVDLSQQRRLEAQIDQARKLETLGRLAGGVAHDFNNHLTAINGFADLILQHSAHDPVTLEHLQYIRRAGELGAALTHQLLAFSRNRPAEIRRVSLNQTLQKCVSILRRLVRENVRLELHLGPDEDFVLADPGDLDNMIINLVVNANDAIPEQGAIRIRTRRFTGVRPYPAQGGAEGTEEFAVLEVEDTGTGMDEWTKGRLFEPFFTTKTEGTGTGLGLAGVYSSVKQAGGWVDVHSEVGRGSVFTVYLPKAGDRVTSVERAPETGKKLSSGTILLVEDQDMVRRFASLTLRGQGYHVVEASSAANALHAARDLTWEISALVTDVVMPGMSGDELARQLRERNPGLVTLFVSGYTFEHAGKLGDTSQPYAFLPKPYTAAELIQHVQDLMRKQPGAVRPT